MFAGNEIRSFGHHAPDAPNPSMVWRAAAPTVATRRSAGVATVAGGVFAAGVVDELDEFDEFDEEDDEHAPANTTPAISAVPSRAIRSIPRMP